MREIKMAENGIDPKKSQNKGKSIPRNTISNNSHKGFFVKTKKQRTYNPKNKETNPDSSKEVETEQQKKPFDKKLYRLKKYSKKYKLQQWEDNRKKSVLKDFYKQVKDDDDKFDVAKIYNDPKNRESDEEWDDTTKTEDTVQVANSETDKIKAKPFYKARHEFNRIKMDKEKKKEELLKSKTEKDEAIKRYRKEKALKYKKLSRKTKKGQPVMKERMEMLLEKIQKMY